ncbi:MAG: nucleoside deaminase [Candidatus Omnitrophica bacterium]|jgi:tRNA(Arg) A34 adenosine deaminase TadA|nr:nucleoside deaminase [Candidatus Omnitrophota bacterium]
MKNKDAFFMRLAIEKARLGVKAGQTPFGALIVKNNRVISCAHNLVWRNNDITAHAEVSAIRAACRKLKTIDLSEATLYSTTEPCPMCFSACHWAGIARIVYGAGIQDAKRYGFRELVISCAKMNCAGKSKIKLSAKVLLKENLGLFDFWRAQNNHRSY